MFDNLRKKLSSFIGNISSKPAEQEQQEKTESDSKEVQFVEKSPINESSVHTTIQKEPTSQIVDIQEIEKQKTDVEPSKSIKTESKHQNEKHPNPVRFKSPSSHKTTDSDKRNEIKEPREIKPLNTSESKKQVESKSEEAKLTQGITNKAQLPKLENLNVKSESPVDLTPKIGLFAKVKTIFTKETVLSKKELDPVFDNLEIALLESDVTPNTSIQLVNSLKSKLEGAKVANSSINDFVSQKVKESLIELFIASDFNLIQAIKTHQSKTDRPYVIVLLGPNGAGKTTTCAKLAKKLLDSNISVIISASDTFRKAAIEQAVIHGKNLNVKVIKQDYGADPTAVAFDSINSAISSKTNVVIVDTAGRQETNSNLLKEIEKMQRVIKPDLKLFVAEALTGHSLVGQALKFKETIGLDGLILTKLDCDVKGGIALSLGYEVKSPILYLGTGQNYDDLIEFNSNWLVSNIIGANN